MKIKNKVIGLTGVAGAGKDLFFELLSNRIPNLKRYALADNLKTDVLTFCLSEYNVNSVKCSREEKNLIRPFLVAHGNTKRSLSSGRYWIDSLTKNIEDDLKDNLLQESDILCITDVRYSEYKKDELYWLKRELNGILVHVSKYEMKNKKRQYVPPANQAESENDPKLKEQADFLVKWPHLKDRNFKKKLEKYVDKFLIDFIIN